MGFYMMYNITREITELLPCKLKYAFIKGQSEPVRKIFKI